MYAYLYRLLALLGEEVLGHSPLIGNPLLPTWNIPLL